MAEDLVRWSVGVLYCFIVHVAEVDVIADAVMTHIYFFGFGLSLRAVVEDWLQVSTVAFVVGGPR